MPYPYEETQTQPPRNSSRWNVLIVVIILLFAVVIGYLLYKPSSNISVPAVVPQAKELTLNLASASIIDDSYNYQPSSEYSQGNPVYIYAEVKDFTQNNNNIDVSEDVEIKDSSGKTIFAQTGFTSLKQTFTQTLPVVKFRNIFPTIKWIPGTYTATLRVNDNIGKKSVTKSLEFTIISKSAESISEVVDLTKLAGNSSSVKLIEFIKTTGPDGKMVPELTYNITYTNSVSNDELSKISASIQIPSRYGAGTYVVEFKFVNTDTGKSQVITKQIVVTKKLEINQLVFASTIDSNFNYQIQPGATYKQGDSVNIYLKLIDFAQPLANGKYNVHFTEDLNVSDSNSQVLLSNSNYVAINDFNTIARDSYSIKNGVLSDQFAPGKYTIKIMIKDLNSGQKAVKEAQFQLE